MCNGLLMLRRRCGRVKGAGPRGAKHTYVPMPGYLMNDTIFTIDTLVYDLRRDKLIWAARSKAKNPTKVAELVKELVDQGIKDLQKRGLVGAGK